MENGARKTQEIVLVLLGAFEFEDDRVWKCYDFDVMDAVHEKGHITPPRDRNKSIHLTEQGLQIAKHFVCDANGRIRAAGSTE